jgi:hypothetical protein
MESKEVKEKGKNEQTNRKNKTNKKFQMYKQGEILY